jgi:alanyl-tRNA synthetase
MLCGNRALQDYNKKEKSVTDISILLSAKPDEVQEAVKNLKAENLSLKGQISALQNKIINYKAAAIEEGTGDICLFDNEIAPEFLRFYANLLIERRSGICAVFTSEDELHYKYILASKSLDVRLLGKGLNDHFQGKGGGTKEMVQGSLAGKRETLLEFVASFKL